MSTVSLIHPPASYTLHDYPQSLKERLGRFDQSLAWEGKPLPFSSRTVEALDLIEIRSGHTKKPEKIKKSIYRKDLYQKMILALGDGSIEKMAGKMREIAPAIEHINKKNPNEFAFRIHFQEDTRILLILLDDTQSADKVMLHRFGNVDVCISARKKDPMFTWHECSQEESQHLHPEFLVRIARYLDNGQTLNMSSFPKWGSGERAYSSDPYQGYLDDFFYYEQLAPNGSLMRTHLPKQLNLLHLTCFKKEILESQAIRVSRAGCIGNLVYTTELVGLQANIMGGHVLGLNQRKFALAPPDKNHFIFMKVDCRNNIITNWIQKYGRGRLFLEAGKEISLGKEVLAQYRSFYPLLAFTDLYGTLIKQNEVKDDHFTKLSFSMLKDSMEKLNAEIGPSILNGIFFESIKDYILLFQSDADSVRWRSVQSFNMGNQYSIFFELCPTLKSDWDTSRFPILFDPVLRVLQERGIISSDADKTLFMQFILDRVFYYLNVACLEGCQTLPEPDDLRSFEDLSSRLPNLSGLIYNQLLKEKHKGSPVYNAYCTALQTAYERSYRNRDIDIAVKSGIARTEEIGIRNGTPVQFFDFDIRNQEDFYEILESQEALPLSIDGISTTNGFTKRYT